MNVAFIPVRGGSKSIPLKNIRPICGKPLVYWTVKAACGCDAIDRVYVATDSSLIRETVENMGFEKVQVIGRSAESASDTASTEFAMLEFAENYDFDNIVLIQATSPLLTSGDLDRGFALFAQEDTDSVLSVVPQKRFNWSRNAEGIAEPTNYDVFHRPRRQEFDGYLVENGAFYITGKADLLSSRNRVSGRIKASEMHEDTFFEIDEPGDWVIIEALMKKNGLDQEEAEEMPEIKMLLTDCDGCLTDGGMYYTEHGDEIKKFNARDGMAFKAIRESGIVTGIVTGEDMDLNRRRAKKMRLDVLVSGCKDKRAAVQQICEERGIDMANVAYIGDDLNDVAVMKAVGYPCCPADAREVVRAAAKCVLKAKGGEGVIREMSEKLLGKFNTNVIDSFSGGV